MTGRERIAMLKCRIGTDREQPGDRGELAVWEYEVNGRWDMPTASTGTVGTMDTSDWTMRKYKRGKL